MQQNIPATDAPTDLSRVRLAIVVGNQIMSVPADGLGSAFGFQPLDSDLTAIAALSTTAYGRSLLESVSASALFASIKQTATDTATGAVELATNLETQTGTDTTRAVTPAGLRSATRELLLANRTYYVRTDGSDSNTGLVNNAGGAFLTKQKAIDVVATLDLGGFTVTIQVGAGTYTGASTLKSIIGGEVIIVGDETTPSNVFVNVSGSCFSADGIFGMWHLRGMKLAATVHGISCQNGARIKYQALDFGTTTFYHILGTAGNIIATGNYSISGSCNTHIILFLGATMQCQSRTVTITGTPAWGSSFINAGAGSSAVMNSNTYSGASTGKRYLISGNGSITTSGGGASYFPGNVAGTTTPDGEYS